MAGRAPKTLAELVRDGTFRARRHHELLGEEPAPWPELAELQARYVAALGDVERRAVAVEFERAAQAAHGTRSAEAARTGGTPLDPLLAKLGPAGSAQQVIRFFPRFFRHEMGAAAGKPFRLERFQRDFVEEFYRRDRWGRRIYRVGLLGLPRGNGKTPLAAGIGVHTLVTHQDAPHIFQVAGSKEQARVGLDFAGTFVETGDLAGHVKVKSSALLCPATRGEMRILSSDGRLAHGRNPSAGVVDEWWLFDSYREKQTYIALSTALHKRPDSFLLGISTAGYDLDSQLGEVYSAALKLPGVELRDQGCLTIARDLDAGFLMWWYGMPADADIEDNKLLRAANPAPWVSVRDLRRELATPGADELEWRRLHGNQWTKLREAWLPTGCWAGLRSDAEIPAGADVYAGIDVALVHDTTAVAWAHQIEDGRIVVRAEVFSAIDGVPAHRFSRGGSIDLEEIEEFVIELATARGYSLREVVADPRFFERSMQRLAKAGITTAPIPQSSKEMADAYQLFYQGCREGLITHNGDPVLAAHVEATAATLTDRGWKVGKVKNSRQTAKRIDACVAAAIASWRASLPKSRPFLASW